MSVSEEVGYNPDTTPHKQAALDSIAGFLLGTSAQVAEKDSVPCYVADMTAGPGIYENGEEGSPLIFARHIANLMSKGYSHMHLICVEKDPDRLNLLRAILRGGYPELNNMVSYFSDQIAAMNHIPCRAVGLTYWDPTGYLALDGVLLRAFAQSHYRMDILITRQGHAAKRLLAAAHTAPRTITPQGYLALIGKKCNYVWQYAKRDKWMFCFADNWRTRPQDEMGGLVPVDKLDAGLGQEGLPWE